MVVKVKEGLEKTRHFGKKIKKYILRDGRKVRNYHTILSKLSEKQQK